MERVIKWLVPETYNNDYQYYRQWITDSWEKSGGQVYEKHYFSLKLRMILGKLNFLANLIPDKIKSQDALIVLCGAHPNYSAWPLMYTHELIPIIWDCWPKYHKTIISSIKQNKIRTVFCTSSQTRDFIKSKLPQVNVYWLPEGIDIDSYKCGEPLKYRNIDVLELGRQLPKLHDALLKINTNHIINHQYSKPGKLLFKTFDDLKEGIANAKITVCYPRCDTHPEMAGDIETLTQRYWECMLSGTLIVGRAPKELIEFCGYNPMINLNDDGANQIIEILSHIDDYQSLVEKNRECALKKSSWDSRMPFIKETLLSLGYVL